MYLKFLLDMANLEAIRLPIFQKIKLKEKN